MKRHRPRPQLFVGNGCARSLVSIALLLAGCGSNTAGEPHAPKSANEPSSPTQRSHDAEIQRAAREELAHAIAEWKPTSAVIVVLDATTGYILASEGHERGRNEPTLPSRKAYVTGSTLKTFTIAAALEKKTVDAHTVVDCATRMYAGAELHDPSPHGRLSIVDVLATSSNVGTSRVYETLGFEPLRAALRRFHIGDPPARPADVTNAREEMVLAIGELAEATPMQMAAAYAAVVNGGVYHAPRSERGVHDDGERVLRTETATTMVTMLENAVSSELGTGKLARVEGLRVAGKTGTSDADDHVYASFIGTVLDSEPRFVALVGLEDPANDGSGPSAAAPTFARLVRRLVAIRTKPEASR